MADTHVGSSVGGRYNIIEKLGEGGMSVVWLARDSRLERLQAIKEIKNNASDATHRVDVDLMRKEAHIMKNLDHPNIVHVNDIIDENGALYVVMDYVPGKDLAKIMRENREAQGGGVYAFPQEDVVDWGIQLCDALGYLHVQNPPVIYRDMKPGNVMLQDDGTVKIIDFGIAREFKPNQSTDTKPLGTRGYASPEAAESVAQTDARSDIYSLGVTLFHLVTGHSPMEFIKQPNLPPIRQLNPTLSPALEQTIIRTNQWDPALRQQTMNELRYELEHPVEPVEYVRMRQTVGRFKTMLIAGIACLVLGIGCFTASRIVRSSGNAGLIERAKSASTAVPADNGPSDAEKLYTQAIEIDPGNIDPYMDLIKNVYTADDRFTVEESQRWRSLHDAHKSSIDRSDRYAELCYETGYDYFFYYDYGSDELSRGSEAVPWFDNAVEYFTEGGTLTKPQRDAAMTFSYIGNFQKFIADKANRGEDVDEYGNYYQSLAQIITSIANEEETGIAVAPIVQLRLYDVITRALGSSKYVRGFRRAGVSIQQVTDLLNSAHEGTMRLSQDAQSGEEIQKLYDSAMNNYQNALDTINENYNSVGAKALTDSKGTTSGKGANS